MTHRELIELADQNPIVAAILRHRIAYMQLMFSYYPWMRSGWRIDPK